MLQAYKPSTPLLAVLLNVLKITFPTDEYHFFSAASIPILPYA